MWASRPLAPLCGLPALSRRGASMGGDSMRETSMGVNSSLPLAAQPSCPCRVSPYRVAPRPLDPTPAYD